MRDPNSGTSDAAEHVLDIEPLRTTALKQPATTGPGNVAANEKHRNALVVSGRNSRHGIRGSRPGGRYDDRHATRRAIEARRLERRSSFVS
jgi:hypothetical protein